MQRWSNWLAVILVLSSGRQSNVFAQNTNSFSTSSRFNASPATAIAVGNHQIAIGYSGGGVKLFDMQSNLVLEISAVANAEKVTQVIAEDQEIWWLAYSPTKTLLYRYDTVEKSVLPFDLSDLNLSNGAKIYRSGTRIAIVSKTASYFLRSSTGLIRPISPENCAQFNANELAPEARPALPQIKSPLRSISVFRDSIWTVQGKAVILSGKDCVPTTAYMGWNESGIIPEAVAATEDGVWVATNHGLRHISVKTNSTETNGYDGFVRIDLNPVNLEESSVESSMLKEATNWFGTPYLYGGATRKGIDCSGFVMCVFQSIGINLPHGSEELRVCTGGITCRDSVRFGDVLVYPGHCSIYIGNGLTAETTNGHVGISSIWNRTDVVVRRFLGVPTENIHPLVSSNKQFSSRNGNKSSKRSVP